MNSKVSPMKQTDNMEGKKEKCEVMEHDFKHLKRFGRADWRCPKCGENVMLLLVYAYQAGIYLTI